MIFGAGWLAGHVGGAARFGPEARLHLGVERGDAAAVAAQHAHELLALGDRQGGALDDDVDQLGPILGPPDAPVDMQRRRSAPAHPREDENVVAAGRPDDLVDLDLLAGQARRLLAEAAGQVDAEQRMEFRALGLAGAFPVGAEDEAGQRLGGDPAFDEIGETRHRFSAALAGAFFQPRGRLEGVADELPGFILEGAGGGRRHQRDTEDQAGERCEKFKHKATPIHGSEPSHRGGYRRPGAEIVNEPRVHSLVSGDLARPAGVPAGPRGCRVYGYDVGSCTGQSRCEGLRIRAGGGEGCQRNAEDDGEGGGKRDISEYDCRRRQAQAGFAGGAPRRQRFRSAPFRVRSRRKHHNGPHQNSSRWREAIDDVFKNGETSRQIDEIKRQIRCDFQVSGGWKLRPLGRCRRQGSKRRRAHDRHQIGQRRRRRRPPADPPPRDRQSARDDRRTHWPQTARLAQDEIAPLERWTVGRTQTPIVKGFEFSPAIFTDAPFD